MVDGSLWKYLKEGVVVRLCKTGDILLDVDDTLFHKTGRKVEGVETFRDAVRSRLHWACTAARDSRLSPPATRTAK